MIASLFAGRITLEPFWSKIFIIIVFVLGTCRINLHITIFMDIFKAVVSIVPIGPKSIELFGMLIKKTNAWGNYHTNAEKSTEGK